jgi:hypothetical protein
MRIVLFGFTFKTVIDTTATAKDGGSGQLMHLSG